MCKMGFFSLLIIAAFIGMGFGGLIAYLRKGEAFDIGHYALVGGIIFFVLAALILTILSRV